MSENTQNDAVSTEDDQTNSSSSSEPTSESAIVELEQKLLDADAKLAEQAELVLRVRADAENSRRRAERDVENAHKYALEGFVEALLPVIDSLEQGLAQTTTHEESTALKQGMELTLKMLVDTLSRKNVQQIDPLGQPFNPEQHEAMSMQESPEFEPNAVIAVFQKGYLLNGRVVRPARVVVNKARPVSVDTQA